jgi:NADPH:quinone reductase-like Zn-dependent oxidoreductase
MRACRIHRYGGPDVIEVEATPRPEPGPGEARVRVRAAGVGPWDAWVRSGRSALPQPLPLTLGADLAGEIDALGEDVAGFTLGEAVFGATNARFTGAYAEYALAVAAKLAPKPARVGYPEAAAAPVVAVTAWQALFEEAKLERGGSVLIHGAAGGVGAFAVQLGRWAGLRILATAGGEDMAFVKSLGADEAIDYRAGRFEDRAHDLDAVIDLVGGDAQRRSFDVLKPGGSLVSTVSEPDRALAESKGVRARFFLVDVTTDRLAKIAGLIDSAVLTVDVGAVMSLASAREAHEALDGERPKPRGKIVLAL